MSQRSSLTQSAHFVRQALTAYKKVVQRYCAQKYLNLPDASKIKDKKW
jgi:hypothetical protein